jgi:hypothetical protein
MTGINLPRCVPDASQMPQSGGQKSYKANIATGWFSERRPFMPGGRYITIRRINDGVAGAAGGGKG